MAITRRVEISKRVPFRELPADIQNLFTSEERDAYEEGASVFKQLAQLTKEKCLIELFNDLPDDAGFEVYLQRFDPKPWTVWFEFKFSRRRMQPRFRLPRTELLSASMPTRIRRIYEGFGGIDEVGDGCYGFLPPEEMESGRELVWNKTNGTGDAAHHQFFYSFGNGDYIGWNSAGEGVFFNHERGLIKAMEHMDGWIDIYMEQLLEPAERPHWAK